MRTKQNVGAALALAVISVLALPASAVAESLAEAMASAYVTNPTLNAARAQLRATDEDVPIARSGHRPSVNLSGDYSRSATRSSTPGVPVSPDWRYNTSHGVAINVEQPIFLGFQTQNSVKAAKTSVLAGREQLRTIEQQVLLDAVQAFMDVVRAQVILNIRAQNVEFLREQVRAANDRLNVGEGTRTDVAQTDARLSAGMSSYSAAVAAVNSAIAVYVEVIGHEPRSLGAVTNIDRLLPKTVDEGLATALAQHPQILAATYNVDVASYNVAIQEGALLPTVTLSGSASHRDSSGGNWTDNASIVGRLNVPIYQRGEISAIVRQSKESLGQRRIELDQSRAAVRQTLISSFGNLDAARAQVRADQAAVSAQQLALSGVIEEQRVGQRTTLDVLDAQQDLLFAREALVNSQFNSVVTAFGLLAAEGLLDARTLGLNVTIYDPTQHYDDVKDKWFGLRTPDGR